MTIFYRLDNKLYINITNACPCACVFCIRNTADGVGEADSLWLTHEPTLEEVKIAFFQNRKNLAEVDEIVFCGYGEPMCRAEDVVEIATFIKLETNLPVRLNTNGLVKLINPGFDIAKLKVMDSISVSLNADDAEEYVRLCQPVFGAPAYAALLEFVKEVPVPTTLSVVGILQPHRIENCKTLAKELGALLRVRSCW